MLDYVFQLIHLKGSFFLDMIFYNSLIRTFTTICARSFLYIQSFLKWPKARQLKQFIYNVFSQKNAKTGVRLVRPLVQKEYCWNIVLYIFLTILNSVRWLFGYIFHNNVVSINVFIKKNNLNYNTRIQHFRIFSFVPAT